MMNEHGYSIDEPASTERELRALLTALVRVVKPSLVVETGCYVGRGTEALVRGVIDNGFGRVVTCDTDHGMVARTVGHVGALHAFNAPCEARCCAGIDLPELIDADLVFLDSDYANRYPEFERVKPGAVVVAHDALHSYDANVSPHEGWIREVGGLVLGTYRGLGIIVKNYARGQKR